MKIETLDARFHHVKAFQCGNESLDAALQVDLVDFGKAYVVVPSRGSSEVLAVFALLPDPGDLVLPQDFVEPLTSIWLNLLAVNKAHQRRGIGKWVLSQIIGEMVEVSVTRRLDYLVVQPLDALLREYFLHINVGFVPIPQSENLILYVDTMRHAASNKPRMNRRIFR